MSTQTLIHMTAPLREDFDIPYHDLGPTDRPPRVALVGGIHGNELNSVFVLARTAAWLRAVATGQHPGRRLLERVVVVPAVNLLGVNTRNRNWPFDGTDLNRMFPGCSVCETTQRIADAVMQATRAAHYRVDIHSSNVDFEELPQVRIYDPSDSERASAALFGLPAVIERPTNTLFSSTLLAAWRQLGGENFAIQAGMAGGLQLHHCERLFQGLVTFLGRVGVVEGAQDAEPEETHHFGPRHAFSLISDHAGLFVSHRSVGHWLQAGDLIGQVFDPFDGALRTEVRAPHAGLLTGLRRLPLLCQGDLAARISTRHAVEGEMVDTYLHGRGQ